MYTALYRAYRPEVFDEILGQEHIVKILKNQINTETTSHAYLFCGTRGTGKTTIARLLAKGLNCLSDGDKPCGKCSACLSIKEGTFLDVVEIDAASNNGVDNIRELRESVKYPPAVGRKKVYIIDEVHMLTSGAYNALLKTLEEPPEYVVFILATTEPHMLASTILSRCMRLDFKRVPEKKLINGMAAICEKKGIDVTEDALRVIAANADGSVRDGLSILDQCLSGGDTVVGIRDVLEFLGASGEETFVELTDLVRRRKTADAMILLDKVLSDGKDVRQFLRDWINHYRNLLMTKFIRDPQDVINMSVENIDRIRRQSDSVELADINRAILELSEALRDAKTSTQPRILLELVIVKLSSNMNVPPAMTTNAAPSVMTPPPVITQDVPPATITPSGAIAMDASAAAKAMDAPAADAAVPLESGNEKDQTAKTEQEAEEAAETFDYDAVWNAVFKDGEAEKGSFYIIGSSGSLTHIGADTFTVTVHSDHVKAHAENNRELLENLMEKHTGKRRRMKLVSGTEEAGQQSDNFQDIVRDVEQLIGVSVEIK